MKDQINTFEEACQSLSLDPKTVIPNFSIFPEKDQKAMTAHSKLIIITDALNRTENNGKEWKPDWDDSNEHKYYPWFDMEGGSAGFLFFVCVCWSTFSHVGSRLCFKTRDLAEYAGKQFEDLYRDYFVK